MVFNRVLRCYILALGGYDLIIVSVHQFIIVLIRIGSVCLNHIVLNRIVLYTYNCTVFYRLFLETFCVTFNRAGVRLAFI